MPSLNTFLLRSIFAGCLALSAVDVGMTLTSPIASAHDFGGTTVSEGEDDPNLLKTSTEGAYTFTIQARLPVTNRTSLYRSALHIYQ